MGRVCCVAAWAVPALLCSGVSASPFVYEPFNYTVGNSANGQSGGTGFFPGSSWAYSEAATSTSTGTIAAGLAFSDLPVSGGSLWLSWCRRARADFRIR